MACKTGQKPAHNAKITLSENKIALATPFFRSLLEAQAKPLLAAVARNAGHLNLRVNPTASLAGPRTYTIEVPKESAAEIIRQALKGS